MADLMPPAPDAQPHIPQHILDYLRNRELARANHRAETLDAMTERERRLVREAAVMGFVQGRIHHDLTPHPSDTLVTNWVIDACNGHPDLYPIIGSLGNGDA